MGVLPAGEPALRRGGLTLSAAPRLVFEEVTKTFRDRMTPRTLRDALGSGLKLLTGGSEPPRTRFVALDRMSFEVAPGEALGLIGHNGAGKTTSLKIAAGVYRPDSGRVTASGPVAAMIELSAGFHPDLTGKENVFLNAALLGLRRREVQKLLPEIVEFSGIGKFIDAPLRVYSTGMEVRLGFAVAAHVPANLLLVDEVLAVGDLDFHTRCVDRMAEKRRDGVSVLFVSHNLSVVEQFCDRVIVVEKGRKCLEGPPREVLDGYRRMILAAPGGPLASLVRRVRRGTGRMRIDEVRFAGPGQDGAIETGRPFSVHLTLAAEPGTPPPTIALTIHAAGGAMLTGAESRGDAMGADPVPERSTVEIAFDRMVLLPGAYQVSVAVRDPQGLSDWDVHEKVYTLAVHGDRPPGELGQTAMPARFRR